MWQCETQGQSLSLLEVMEEPLQMHRNAAHVKGSKEDGAGAIVFSLWPLVLVLKGPQLPFVPPSIFFALSLSAGYSHYVFGCALKQVLWSSWEHWLVICVLSLSPWDPGVMLFLNTSFGMSVLSELLATQHSLIHWSPIPSILIKATCPLSFWQWHTAQHLSW